MGVLDVLRTWMIAEGLDVDGSADGSVLEVRLPETADRKLRVVAIPDDPFLHFSMVARARVPRARWAALYPLLSDANARLSAGAWVLDPDTERLLYRLSIPYAGASYDAAALRAVLGQVASTVRSMEAGFRGVQSDEILAAWLAETDPA